MRIEVVLTPADIATLPSRDLSGETCVVFDVLRATTSFITALAHNARAVWPVESIGEALALKQSMPDAVLGGERGGNRIDGFDVGNSPAEYTGFAGRDIISTTTNGTVALQACRGAAVTLASGFLNLDATIAHIRAIHAPLVRIVCAGTFEDFAFEDGMAAGALVDGLGASSLGDAAVAMRDLYLHHRDKLAEAIKSTGNGRVLVVGGRERDVDWALRRDLYPVAALRNGGAIVRGPDREPL
jgi:2-phosphosulfolactate phosphatase